jgi:pyruvate kinase
MFPDLAPIQHSLQTPADALEALLAVRQQVIAEGRARFDGWRSQITRRSFLMSGLNFAQYLALRRRDLRPLQAVLSPWGLSSLGRIEAHVQPNLDAVLATLADIGRLDHPDLPKRPRPNQFLRGDRILANNTTEVFGVGSAGRRVRVMVTLPSEAASNYGLVRDLMTHGMNIARINCAHDDATAWESMVAYVRRAERETGLACKIAMDLAGPKSRTADLRKPEAGVLFKGDTVLMTADKPPKDHGATMALRCTLTDALGQLKIGQAVYFDDGRIGGLVEHLRPEGVMVRITRARDIGEKLKADKGVNFPDTDLRLNPLTDKDLQDLDFVAAYADMVNYSFVQSAADIARLQTELAARADKRVGLPQIALIAKIETARAVRALPEIIVRAAGVQPFGVMIARGDLAVEIGWERLAEIQEQILWLCEAAHVPVIWATQVLEGLAKDGLPSRAEITDAAMAERAECVMLNKGPYILDALNILDGVLRRMETHQIKKSSRLRALKSWATM